MNSSLPFLIAGPILRKTTSEEIVFWLVTSEPLSGHFELKLEPQLGTLFSQDLSECQQLAIGKHCYLTLAQFKGKFPTNVALSYEFITQHGALTSLYPELLYNDEQSLTFKISTKADYILHGSCRNPHHPSKDALIQINAKVANQTLEERPDLLMMSGDQIYADHVAGPTLDAILQTIKLLGLPHEQFVQAPISSSQELYAHPDCYYGRDNILPHYVDDGSWLTKLFPHRNTPIFSSREAENHLVTFSEFFAMYLLVWSPTLWPYLNINNLLDKKFTHANKPIPPLFQQQWREEKAIIDEFVAGLPQVQRLFAHIPTYMIFDDHDVTDDWNLTIGWEKAAYGNPFSNRIIGNGLAAYWLCQGWGNEPDNFNQEFLAIAERFLSQPGAQQQDDFIQYLYTFERWHYTIHSSPKVVVLDTRTRRWRSESRMNKPSGLMDWEALVEFQQELMHQDKVVIVSAAPMFGVKFIEALQKGATMLGQPLLIDAENWMAHPGSANTLLSIFTHTKTPTNFVILSGDVHYSFAYDIKLRFRRNSPNIFQITCSGFKNQFPEPLLGFCDHADRLLYSPRSPLNFLTKRKRLKVKKRDPNTEGVRRLVNTSAVGELKLDSHGKPERISILTGYGVEWDFPPIKEK
ncbi:alkaline phosphatase D family protein [Vibrio europaeus]|uniref:alkaline phosphatase D family protein n=1 Tax=Vibrio europaeus TaxID=300876 RepID=UPI00148C5F8D|nr:alkaline phosphatase D family protein [Vibrio europaeus]MDC5809606.1 alkaline phosphatase family protein [Vibrio europaeus]NOH23945.1 alkaline phosphatase family protein [Vibrio europaeus]QPG35331.1 alkaline phosphatase family protein [Vibrio europaeus]